MLRTSLLSCLLLFIAPFAKSQNLIKNGSFTKELAHWECTADVRNIVQNNLAFISNQFFPFLFYNKYASSYLKMGDGASIAQSIETKVGEMYNIHIKYLSNRNVCTRINIYINGEEVKKEIICHEDIPHPYLKVDFLAEERLSLIRIESQYVSSDSAAFCITEIVCTNKNTVNWEKYYRD